MPTGQQMKRIAIFCDGTWNRLSAPNPTHVARLARAVTPSAVDGVKQLVYYQQGVGTGRGTNGIARKMDRLLGGALGWGLDDNIVEAYRNLIFWYEPGDEIFIFGFSRGAYTARSLAGLIRTAGLPPRTHLPRLQEAVSLYRARGDDTHPDAERSRRFRRSFAPLTATSKTDLEWRRSQGDEDAFLLRLAYLGVWDTVGALGLPGVFGAVSKVINRKYAFHDADLSRMVRAARHAVAIDERRRFYPPTMWDNLDALNGPEANEEQRTYRQEWFPGVHSVVGGSGVVPGLSAFSADWVVEGARDLKLEFDRIALQKIAGGKDAAADAEPMVQMAGLTNLFGQMLQDRAGPDNVSDVSEAARLRVRARPDYRPGPLGAVIGELV